MGQLSLTHLLLLLIIVLVFFGPSRLPGLGKSLGEAIRGFKKGLDGTESDSQNETNAKNTQQHPGHGGPSQHHQVTSRHVSPLELPENDSQGVHNHDGSHNTHNRRNS